VSAEAAQTERRMYMRWVRATSLGWLVGFGLMIVLAIAWDIIGGGAQFMVGVGMGAGVGYLQGRVVGEWIESVRAWLLASIIGMGAPFVLWDIGAATGMDFPFSLPLSVVMGGLLVGVLQRRVLRPHSDRANWWVPVCTVGWALPAGLIAFGDADVVPDLGGILSISGMLLGGVILGAVTGKPLIWMLR